MKLRLSIVVLWLASTPAWAVCNVVNGRAYGDCAGVTVNTGRQAFSEVKTYQHITGVSEGARVLSGGTLTVSGIAEVVEVQPGGHAHVQGIVNALRNNGGTV